MNTKRDIAAEMQRSAEGEARKAAGLFCKALTSIAAGDFFAALGELFNAEKFAGVAIYQHGEARLVARYFYGLQGFADGVAAVSGLSAVPCFCGSRLPPVQGDREMPSCPICNAI